VDIVVTFEVPRAVLVTNGRGDSWPEVNDGEMLVCGRPINPQAENRKSIIHAITRLLNTLAVYHKIYPAWEILNPCE